MEFYLELLFTAIVSVLLAALLGHLFSVAADDDAADRDARPMAMNSGGGERRGNDSLIPDRVVEEEDRSDSVMKCEEEKESGVDEVRSDEISGKASRDEVKIEGFDGDLAKSQPRADEELVTDEKVGAFFGLGEGTSSRVDDARETREVEEREWLEEEKELQFGMEKELGAEARVETEGKAEAFLVKGFECGDNVVGSTGDEIECLVNELDGLEHNNYVREMREVRENEFLEEAKEVDAPRMETEAKVGKADLFLVKDVECEEDLLRSRGEDVVKERSESEVGRSADDEKGQSLLGDEDEWEGVERTELEKQFREAAAYVDTEGGEFALSSLSDDEQMQLYGLHKVAVEGPCYDPQPMALKVSARAKWHAWQRLGNMNPDAAMERYMSFLSEKVPGWMGEHPEGDVKKQDASEVVEPTLSGTLMPTLCLNIPSQLNVETERRQECPSFVNEEIESATTDHAGKETELGFKQMYNEERMPRETFSLKGEFKIKYNQQIVTWLKSPI